MERKFKIGKFGLQENPIHHHVAMGYRGRNLLGEVYGIYHDETRGMTHLRVRHFCGDVWPIDPQVLAVNVIGA